MATFSNHPRNNAAVQAFQWHTVDGQQLPWVKYFAQGDYYYFDNQQPANNIYPINDGDWVVQQGNGPNTKYYVMTDNDFQLAFN